MSDDAAWEIQQLIEQKREEIRCLLAARDVLLIAAGQTPPESEEEPRSLEPKLDPVPAPDPKVDKARDRRKVIAARAKKIGLDKRRGPNRRRKFTADEKLAILEEVERTPKKSTVLKKYRISYTALSNWKKAVIAGKLVPSAVSDPEPEAEEQEPDPFEEGKPLPPSFPLPE